MQFLVSLGSFESKVRKKQLLRLVETSRETLYYVFKYENLGPMNE